MFSKSLLFVAAASVASVTAQTTSTSSIAAAPTAVTDCHAHGESELFCFDADNEEWELTSPGFTADNLPNEFDGCHMHDEELHCVDGDTEATLVSASSEDEHDHAEDEHDHDHDHAEASSSTSTIVNASTTMTSVIAAAATGSNNSTTTSASATSSTTSTSAAPSAVSNCHTHADTELYCFDNGDEWMVTSEWDQSNPPRSYEGCHMHGTELHCVDGDVDATLVAAAEEHVDSEATSNNSTESSTAESSNSESSASVSMTTSHAALVFTVCLLALTAYAY